MKKLKLNIEGMHCASCVGNVKKSLMNIKGVKDASINLILKSGRVEAEDNVSLEEIKKAVSKIGYKVTNITAE